MPPLPQFPRNPDAFPVIFTKRIRAGALLRAFGTGAYLMAPEQR